MTYKFPCGCEAPVTAPPTPNYPLPGLAVDPDSISFCPAVKALFASGRTKGIFQLEKQLGQTWSRRLKPETHEHICALLSLLRPGCLHRDSTGMSMTQKFVNRKNGEPPEPFHPVVDEILSNTYSVITYQEQVTRLAAEIAKFSETEADDVRKSIGKKDPELMAKVRRNFITKAAEAQIISQEQAEDLFDIIQSSARYLFNRSHSWSYGKLTILTAWLKAHSPLAFFYAWVKSAHRKGDSDEEVYELVEDAKLFSVPIRVPDLRSRLYRSSVYQQGVNFGLADVKGVGEGRLDNLFKRVAELEPELGPLPGWTWEQFLLRASDATVSTVIEGLASAGALAFFGKPRLRLMTEYRVWRKLTPTEQTWLQSNYTRGESLADLIRRGAKLRSKGGMLARSDRAEMVLAEAKLLDKPPSDESDTPRVVAELEEKFLGTPISCTKLSGCDTSDATITCLELADGAKPPSCRVAVELKPPREFETKTNRKMAWLTIADNSATLNDVICFPDQWEQYNSILRGGNTVLLEMSPSKKGDGWIVEKASQI